MIRAPRRLDDDEIEALLNRDLLARLASLDSRGFPHVTPLWFVWADGAFQMTSISDRPHLRRLARNPHAGLCVDAEQPQRPDGQRPNQQVRAVGDAELFPDGGQAWTHRIDGKYLSPDAAARRAAARAGDERVVIRLRPVRLIAVGSV
jgi:Pyridoxamine 5'-phosphate oxidase